MKKEDIDSHWKYLKEAIRDGRDESKIIRMTVKEYLERIEYHYKTAMEHGVKHDKEGR